jgi:hypothetical protein
MATCKIIEFLSTEAVDNSVEKRGSFTLSARSVSGPVKLVKKLAEIGNDSFEFKGLRPALDTALPVLIENIAMGVTIDVRKSLILRPSRRQPS